MCTTFVFALFPTGLFLRRMNLLFDKLSFNQVTQLHAQYRKYYRAWTPPEDASDALTGSRHVTFILPPHQYVG